MNSDIFYYSILGLNLILVLVISFRFFLKKKTKKNNFAHTGDFWTERSVWQAYERLSEHQQQLSEWQRLFDQKSNTIGLSIANIKQDLFSLDPISEASSEVIQVSKDERYLRDIEVLGFEYCINWAIDDVEEEYQSRPTIIWEIDVIQGKHTDLVFCFRLVLDLLRCVAIKQNNASVFVLLQISKEQIELKFEEGEAEISPTSNEEIEKLISRVKSRLRSRGIPIPGSFFKAQSVDVEFSKTIKT